MKDVVYLQCEAMNVSRAGALSGSTAFCSLTPF